MQVNYIKITMQQQQEHINKAISKHSYINWNDRFSKQCGILDHEFHQLTSTNTEKTQISLNQQQWTATTSNYRTCKLISK